MYAQAVSYLPAAELCSYEAKLDGYGCLATKHSSDIRKPGHKFIATAPLEHNADHVTHNQSASAITPLSYFLAAWVKYKINHSEEFVMGGYNLGIHSTPNPRN